MKHLLAITMFALLAQQSAARADDPAPWAVGVTAEQKASAQHLLDAGNTLFVEHKYTEALAEYQHAVGAWNHPAIRFNIVRCLIQLDRSVEASEELALTLAYGAAPLEEAVYTEALAYGKLLAKQVADVAVACTQPGVEITLDGKQLLACPGSAARHVAPGKHQIVGTKAGFLTSTTTVFVDGGGKQELKLALDPRERAAKIVHRYPAWLPWVVFGSGVVVTGLGGLLEAQAAGASRDYDRAVAGACGSPGCTPQDPSYGALADQRASAERQNAAAIGVMVAGSAAVVTGAVLLYLNRGRTVYPDEVVTPVVTPLPGGGGAVSVLGHF